MLDSRLRDAGRRWASLGSTEITSEPGLPTLCRGGFSSARFGGRIPGMSEKAQRRLFERQTFFVFAGIPVLVLVATLPLLLYMEYRMDDLEDALQYKPPRVERTQANGMTSVPDESHLIYVPAYSHVYSSGGKGHSLEITLSIRNVNPTASITINAADYYDTDGKLVRRFMSAPQRLGPLGTTEFLIEQEDVSGGSGANFLVAWAGEAGVSAPLCETVMIGSMKGQQGVSFARPGVSINGPSGDSASP